MAHLRGFGRLLKMTICHVSRWHTYAILSGESIKGRQSVAVPLANDFCKSDHLQLSISHFWPFNVAKCCQRNSRDHGPSHSRKKHGLWTNWPNIATKFAKRGTHKSLLLLNWSSWHHAASATRWTEFESNTKSPTSPGESSARLPTSPQPHRHLWCHCWSTWSAQKGTVVDIQRPGKMAYRKKVTGMHTMKILGKSPTKQNRSTRVNRRQFRRVDALAVR